MPIEEAARQSPSSHTDGNRAQPRPGRFFSMTETVSSVMAIHIQCSQRNFTHRVRDTNGSEKVLCLLSTIPLLVTPPQQPRLLHLFSVHPTPLPIYEPNPGIDAKGVPGNRGWLLGPLPLTFFFQCGRMPSCSMSCTASNTGLDRQSFGPSFPRCNPVGC